MSESRVRFVIEPNRFQRMLENVLMYHKQVELDAIAGRFLPAGALFMDTSLEVMFLSAVFSASYYLEYECTEETMVPFSKSLIDWMKVAFTEDDKVEVIVTEKKILIQGKMEKYEEDLTEIEAKAPSIPFAVHQDDIACLGEEPGDLGIEVLDDASIRGKGIVPKKLNPTAQLLVKVDSLKGLPTAENVKLACEDGEIQVTVEGVGSYTKTIKPQKTDLSKDIAMTFSYKYLMKAVVQFDGEVWMTLRKDAVVFSQRNKDSLVSYLLSSSD